MDGDVASIGVLAQVPDLTTTIIGWRAWSIHDGGLCSTGLAADDRWPVEKPLRAACAYPIRSVGTIFHLAGHSSPAEYCTCGIYAKRNREQLVEDVLRLSPTRYNFYETAPTRAVGTVRLWGKVIRHEDGYRAELAYPATITEIWLGDDCDTDTLVVKLLRDLAEAYKGVESPRIPPLEVARIVRVVRPVPLPAVEPNLIIVPIFPYEDFLCAIPGVPLLPVPLKKLTLEEIVQNYRAQEATENLPILDEDYFSKRSSIPILDGAYMLKRMQEELAEAAQSTLNAELNFLVDLRTADFVFSQSPFFAKPLLGQQ